MKQKLKQLFKIFFCVDTNILFYINVSALITAIILFIFALITAETNTNSSNVFTYISSIWFALWLVSSQDNNSVTKFALELMRLSIFFLIFIFSFYGCANFVFNYNTTSIIGVIFSSFGLLLCICYFIVKLTSIFEFTKKLFKKLKAKLFDSDKPATTKTKALIENITAFLVSIGGLTVAIKSIAESVFKILDYFK